MALPQFSSIRLVNDRHVDEGVACGAVGVILDVYDTGDYEVEFSRPDGTTIAWFSVHPDEVEVEDNSDSKLFRRTGD